MKKYIGTKLIRAKVMNRNDYNALRNWPVPDDEDGGDQGYLVEYIDGGQANHPDFEGYISWSPKDVFERSYRESSGMTFGMAYEAMRLGLNVSREGWNGKGMYVYLVRGTHPFNLAIDGGNINGVDASLFDMSDAGTRTCMPHVNMKAADDSVVTGWLASQTDMAANDWGVVGL